MQRRLTAFNTKPRKALTAKKGFTRKIPQNTKNRPLSTKKRAKKRRKDKLPALSTMRNKCDKLLTPIIKAMHPYCLLQGAEKCAHVTQVAHHHVHKSKSTYLRYDIKNLIPLCHACHSMLHNDESSWGAKVASLRGPEWFAYLEQGKRETVDIDVHFYIANYARLKELQDTLV